MEALLRSWLLTGLLGTAAGAGVLTLQDGRELQGALRPDPAAGFVLAEQGGKELKLSVTQIKSVRFDSRDAGWRKPAGGQPDAARGWRGTYFEGTELRGKERTRLDPVIDFGWGGGGPFPGWREEHFSARWTGRLTPPRDGEYTFTTLSDDGVRLWLDGRQIINNWTDHAGTEDHARVTLKGGETKDVRLEYFENGGEAVMHLLWSGPGLEKRPIGPEFVTPAGDVVVEAPRLDERKIGLQAGVVMRDGTVLAARVRQANDTAFVLEAPFDGLTISAINVARVLFREIDSRRASILEPGRVGACLISGDFVDGEFQGLERGALKLSSLLFGVQTLDTKYETAVLQLRKPQPDATPFLVRLLDGSALLAKSVEVQADGLLLRSLVLGALPVAFARVAEVHHAPGTNLFPASVWFGPASVHGEKSSADRKDHLEWRAKAESLSRLTQQEKDIRARAEYELRRQIAAEQDAVTTAVASRASLEKKLADAEKRHVELEVERQKGEAALKEAEQKAKAAEAAQQENERAVSRTKREAGEAEQAAKSARSRLREHHGRKNSRKLDEAERKRRDEEVRKLEQTVRELEQVAAAKDKAAREVNAVKLGIMKNAGDARNVLRSRQSDVYRQRAASDSARKERDYLRRQLDEATQRLATARAKVEERARTALR